MTCVDATREDVDAVVRDFASLGVTRFVALRGDPAADKFSVFLYRQGRLIAVESVRI